MYRDRLGLAQLLCTLFHFRKLISGTLLLQLMILISSCRRTKRGFSLKSALSEQHTLCHRPFAHHTLPQDLGYYSYPTAQGFASLLLIRTCRRAGQVPNLSQDPAPLVGSPLLGNPACPRSRAGPGGSLQFLQGMPPSIGFAFLGTCCQHLLIERLMSNPFHRPCPYPQGSGVTKGNMGCQLSHSRYSAPPFWEDHRQLIRVPPLKAQKTNKVARIYLVPSTRTVSLYL